MRAFVQCHVVVVLALCAAACRQHREVIPNDLPAELILLPKARHVKYTRGDQSVTIGYEADLAFPADVLLGTINRSLGSPWRALNDIWLNPGVASSHVTGWTYYPDGRHYWRAEWRAPDDRMVEYILQYQSVKPGDGHTLSQPDNARLRVIATMFSRSYVLSTEHDVRTRLIGQGSAPSRGLTPAAPVAAKSAGGAGEPSRLPGFESSDAARGALHNTRMEPTPSGS
jgi:hypothetical protein